MQPLILSIPGDFWDVQIYRGRLYLWHYDGRLSVYDWEKLVELAYPKASQSLAVKAAWLRGNSLYHPDVLAVFEDPAFRKLLEKELAKLTSEAPVITPKMLEKSLYGEQDNPVKELPTDTEIFGNILYLVTYDAFWSATAHRNNRRYPVSSRPKKRWDAQAFSASASHGRIVLSAGDDGLFEFDLRYSDDNPNGGKVYFPGSNDENGSVSQLTGRHSSYADWSFSSVYSTSQAGESCLLAFRWQRDPATSGRLQREFVREIDESEILQRGLVPSLSWGAGDKICAIYGTEVTVMRYVQKNVTKPETDTHNALLVSDRTTTPSSAKAMTDATDRCAESPFDSVGSVPLKTEADVIKAGLAYFGILLETPDHLHVLRSDKDVWSMPGPIVRWRTYPRAKVLRESPTHYRPGRRAHRRFLARLLAAAGRKDRRHQIPLSTQSSAVDTLTLRAKMPPDTSSAEFGAKISGRSEIMAKM